MLTKTGAKLLDFGLARPASGLGAVSGSTALPTEAKPLTSEGTILGTFQYMAPEQLEGAEADARTDIFALGALLYEMATGRRAFDGKSKTSLIAAILSTQPPPISSVQPVMPPALDHVVKKCLEKDPDDRWQSAHDVASELRWIGEAGSQAGVPATLSLRRRSRERLAWLLAGGLGLLWLLTLVPATLHWRERAPESLPVRFTISPPDKTAFAAFDVPAVSPDGKRFVFVAAPAGGSRATLWMRSLESLSAQPLPGTEGGFFPFWSPDARAVAFFGDGALKKIEVAGGGAQTLCATSGAGGGAWNQHGDILFAGRCRSDLQDTGWRRRAEARHDARRVAPGDTASLAELPPGRPAFPVPGSRPAAGQKRGLRRVAGWIRGSAARLRRLTRRLRATGLPALRSRGHPDGAAVRCGEAAPHAATPRPWPSRSRRSERPPAGRFPFPPAGCSPTERAPTSRKASSPGSTARVASSTRWVSPRTTRTPRSRPTASVSPSAGATRRP